MVLGLFVIMALQNIGVELMPLVAGLGVAGAAVALALQGVLGLVCDPVGGLVEVPCVARNATAASVALAGVEMALAGVTFPIPFDEVADTLAAVGKALPPSLRETARAGLAVTPTGRQLARGSATTRCSWTAPETS
jgi:L-serine dehydratase